jgi:WD40 repeat protein
LRRLAVGLSVPGVTLWDLRTQAQTVIAKAEGRELLLLSPSGGLLATSRYGGAQVWDAATGGLRVDLGGHLGEVQHASFAADEQTLTTAGSDGVLKAWDLNTGELKEDLDGLTLWPAPIP